MVIMVKELGLMGVMGVMVESESERRDLPPRPSAWALWMRSRRTTLPEM
jgi:hypothetical protein